MKIIHTPVRFYPYMGGVEHSTYHLCKALVKQGCDVGVLCADEGPGKTNEVLDGITVHRLPYVCKVANTNITPKLPFRLWQEPYDIMHTYMPTPWSADWSVLIGKLRSKKTIISIKNDMHHDSFLANLIDKIYVYTLFRLTLRLVDRIFMVNPNWETTFVNTRPMFRAHKRKMVIVPNGIDLTVFQHAPVKRQKHEILFVSILSSYHKYKGLDNLLQAVKKLAVSMAGVHLTIAGDGELRPMYEEMVDQLGIRQHVTFVGQVDQKKLPALYARASVFVLPSKGVEGFGNVVLESLACGTPVVVTNVVGMANDLERTACGIVIPPDQPEALGAALRNVMEDAQAWKHMSERGMALVHETYSWDAVATQVKGVYEELLHGV